MIKGTIITPDYIGTVQSIERVTELTIGSKLIQKYTGKTHTILSINLMVDKENTLVICLKLAPAPSKATHYIPLNLVQKFFWQKGQ